MEDSMKRRNVVSIPKQVSQFPNHNSITATTVSTTNNHRKSWAIRTFAAVKVKFSYRKPSIRRRLLLLLVVLSVGWKVFGCRLLLGHHSIRGGLLGPFLDSLGRDYMASRTQAAARKASRIASTRNAPKSKFEPIESFPTDPHVVVTVQMATPTPASTSTTTPHEKTHKQTLLSQLMASNCEPSWWCNRCLRYAGRGTFSQCSWTCPACLRDVLCSPEPKDPSSTTVNVKVQRPTNTNTLTNTPLIPRIIHQTWFEELTPERYPQLTRLQNSWKAQHNWEYRFYTDDDAQFFLKQHYPPLFLEAYVSLNHGAYRADLFRYCVLLIHGGVYADIDVWLNTDLDTLLSLEGNAQVGFVAPRDTPGYVTEEYNCLWNGLIGAAPGHPILLTAVERTVRLIRMRADQYDIERYACTHRGAADTLSESESELQWWKGRTEIGLFLSGPCALGVAFNTVQNHGDPYASIGLGMQPLTLTLGSNVNTNTTRVAAMDQNRWTESFGHALILQQKKHDLGAHRFTDPVRNVIVASTDLPGMSKSKQPVDVNEQPYEGSTQSALRSVPVPVPVPFSKKSQTAHYSQASDGYQIWGSRFVYVDDLVVKEDTLVLELVLE